MSDDGRKALIPKPAFDLRQSDPGAEKVLSRIVSDALTVARRHDVARTPVRIRIGKYEFREQDYRQIVIWAQEIGKTPEELVSLLEDGKLFVGNGSIIDNFLVDDGSIIEIAFAEKPIFPHHILRISLPNLVKIRCSHNELTALEISSSPKLEELFCDNNCLAKLNLSNVPLLTVLHCWENQLAQLDLSNVVALTRLCCKQNQLTHLDLSNVPALTDLTCSWNQLTKLDLSNLPALTALYCRCNELTELDLSNIPQLKKLHCRNNQITMLDVRGNPNLRAIACDQSVNIIKYEWQSFPDRISDLRVVPDESFDLSCKHNI